ncbi:MAG TPA: NAD(P)/FAD-dependent oxidoreductase [Candidatus Acidoferrum sp.]|nr:NAD(P)/FAD-dependent oxidoreductase [Candidatus Acidoferrum sp.]
MNARHKHDGDADVIVIGGGIAGLGAAVRLKDRGLEPLVLEADSRVGGRMTTDRANGFVIDRGVTLFGNGFRSMRALVKRLALSSLVCPGGFSVGIQDAAGCRGYRGRHFGDLLFDRGMSMRARLGSLRFGMDLLRFSRALQHGNSVLSGPIDGEDCQTYFRRVGGTEIFERIFWPGLNGPMGGSVEKSSRVILMQVIWNLLVRGQWNLTDGVDRIPEAAAAQVRVVTGAKVLHVEKHGTGVHVDAEIEGQQRRLRARGVIFAVPGRLVPALCPGLPSDLREVLARTQHSKIANAAVALSRPPNVPYAGYAFTPDVVPGAEIEMEHLRAPNRCPKGRGMAGVFLWDTPQKRRLDADDESLKQQASEIVEQMFPECRGKVLFVHLVRWNIGIAQFPPGRLKEMTAVRRRMAAWQEPYDLCGDYLDGLSSESALRTGEEAAERTVRKLSTNRT